MCHLLNKWTSAFILHLKPQPQVVFSSQKPNWNTYDKLKIIIFVPISSSYHPYTWPTVCCKLNVPRIQQHHWKSMPREVNTEVYSNRIVTNHPVHYRRQQFVHRVCRYGVQSFSSASCSSPFLPIHSFVWFVASPNKFLREGTGMGDEREQANHKLEKECCNHQGNECRQKHFRSKKKLF